MGHTIHRDPVASRCVRPLVRRARGFSLVEMMITVSVLAIILAMAVPSFTAIVNGNRLTAQANELVASLQLARSEAIRRNLKVMVCRSSDGSTCDASATTWTRWIVSIVSTGEVLRSNQVNSSLQLLSSSLVSGNGNRVVFSADGLARDSSADLLGAQLSVCMTTARPVQNVRLVSVAAGSRIATTSSSGSAACAVPADA